MKSTCLAVFGVIASSLLSASARSLVLDCKDLKGDYVNLAHKCKQCADSTYNSGACKGVPTGSDWEYFCKCVRDGAIEPGPEPEPKPEPKPARPRPIYAIANRVLEVQHIKTALKDGANAILIDATPWNNGWWADHDGLPTSAGDTMMDMFKFIAKARSENQNISFVWVEIHYPDWCSLDDKDWYHCSVRKLKELAENYLESVGVPVLYSFPGTGPGYEYVKGRLGNLGAISLAGKAADVEKKFARDTKLPTTKRVMNYGYFDWASWFHDYRKELVKAVESGKFGKVFGWTYAGGRKLELDMLLASGVDGIVYGFKHTAYYDHDNTRRAIQDIKDWVEENNSAAYLATLDEKPW